VCFLLKKLALLKGLNSLLLQVLHRLLAKTRATSDTSCPQPSPASDRKRFLQSCRDVDWHFTRREKLDANSEKTNDPVYSQSKKHHTCPCWQSRTTTTYLSQAKAVPINQTSSLSLPTRLSHYCSSVSHFLADLPEEARFPVKSKKRLEALTFPDSPNPWLTTNSPAPVTKRSILIPIYDWVPSMGAGM
jgi:hypothetical protein